MQKNAEKFHYFAQCKNAHLIQKMSKNSINAGKCRKLPLKQKNSKNAEKFN
jgi:hypothetical protein